MLSLMIISLALLIGGLVFAFLISPFLPVSKKTFKRLFFGSLIAAAFGLILELLVIFVLDDTDYSSENKDNYTGSLQYYEDAYEYYQDNDNWNRDFGEDYGYRW